MLIPLHLSFAIASPPILLSHPLSPYDYAKALPLCEPRPCIFPAFPSPFRTLYSVMLFIFSLGTFSFRRQSPLFPLHWRRFAQRRIAPVLSLQLRHFGGASRPSRCTKSHSSATLPYSRPSIRRLFRHSRSPLPSVLSTLYSTLSTFYSALCTQYSALCTQYSVLSTQYSALSTQHSVLSTQYFLLCPLRSFPAFRSRVSAENRPKTPHSATNTRKYCSTPPPLQQPAEHIAPLLQQIRSVSAQPLFVVKCT
jgi:hypothetical protein